MIQKMFRQDTYLNIFKIKENFSNDSHFHYLQLDLVFDNQSKIIFENEGQGIHSQ